MYFLIEKFGYLSGTLIGISFIYLRYLLLAGLAFFILYTWRPSFLKGLENSKERSETGTNTIRNWIFPLYDFHLWSDRFGDIFSEQMGLHTDLHGYFYSRLYLFGSLTVLFDLFARHLFLLDTPPDTPSAILQNYA